MDRRQILSDNKGKSGVYCIINKINGNKYVGSSVRLRTRFLEYLNVKYLERNKNMPICLSLLKYGHSNFSLEIVEYCEIPCLLYWEIVRAARTILGKKHEEETKMQIAASQPHSKKIEVFDLETNQASTYNSIKAAAKALAIPQCSISRYFTKNQQTPYKGRFIFRKKSC